MHHIGETIGFARGRLSLSSRTVVWGLGALAAVAVALPAVWWESLHGDEVVTLDIAPRPFGEIVDVVFVDRGGAPVHFLLEHVFLAWPGGIEGLRLPSLAFFLIALPAAGLVADRLVGRAAALLLVPTLALAPLAVELATFGRMYSLFLASTLWTTLLALIAAERGRPALWAAAGLALGALVYIHPIAPLYIGVALLSALIHEWSGLGATLRAAWPAPVAIVLVGLPFYVESLSTLRDRYDVESGGGRLRTGQGESVAELAWDALLPGGAAEGTAFLLLAAAGVVALARSRPRTAAVVVLWVFVPVAFFTLVPAEGTLFFPRYLLPGLPYLLLAVLCGPLALARRLGAPGTVAAAAAVAALLVTEAYRDFERLRTLSALELRALTATLAEDRENGVLFSSAGAPNLDRYVVLEAGGIRRVESTCSYLMPYLTGSQTPRRGIWLFSGSERALARGSERMRGWRDLRVERIGSSVVLVRTVGAFPPRDLIMRGLELRETWSAGNAGPRAERRARRETAALRGDCPVS